MMLQRFITLDSDGESDYVYDYGIVENGDDVLYILDVSKDGEHWYTEELTEDEYYDAMCEHTYNETERAGAACGY